MNLIIDIGNTRVKAALFNNKELKQSFVFGSHQHFIQADLFAKHPVTHCLIASVVNEIEMLVKYVESQTNVFLFTAQSPIPIHNKYQTAHTLGSDRLAAAIGGNAQHPNKDILIIDAGTCIKYNFVNHQNEYIGGGISPGVAMRFKAINKFTSRLPLLQIDEDFETLIGKNSNESILSGVQTGVICEVQGIIEQYKILFPQILVILTGGDVNFFASRLKKPIFADQFLVLKGLNEILEFNISKKAANSRKDNDKK